MLNFNWQGYKKAIENEFRIVNKDKINVPFLLNKAQDHCIQHLQGRNVILKSRKMGFSSMLLAIAALKFIFGRNERCVSMSFDESASTKQLERAKHFIQSYEVSESKRLGKTFKIPTKYNNKKELVYEDIDPKTGEHFTNTLRIGTAQTDSFGRGDDISFLHLTEVSLANNLSDLLAGVGEATVNNSMITLETTANGYNAFKSFWEEAQRGERGYTALFYDPTWEYSPEYLADKKQQLKEKFNQEYPMTPAEAFISSGELYFDKLSMKWYLEHIKSQMTEGVIYV